MFVVHRLSLEFLRPSQLDDMLEVTVEPVRISPGRMRLAQRIRRGDEELVVAQVELACVNTVSFRPVRIPEPVFEKAGKTK